MKTLKITEEAYQILAAIKWSSKSKTFSETITKMNEEIKTFAPNDSVVNTRNLIGVKK